MNLQVTSVVRRLAVDRVDDELVEGAACRFEFQAELVLDGGEDSRRGIRQDSAVWGAAHRREMNLEVVVALEAGFVENGRPSRLLDEASNVGCGLVLSRPKEFTWSRAANRAFVVGRQDREALWVNPSEAPLRS